MRVLITGITGFVGSHLAELALREGAEVYGSIRWRSKTENIESIRDRLTLIDCDLRDFCAVQALVDAARPDRIFHLAAQSFVGVSFEQPVTTGEITGVGVYPSSACTITVTPFAASTSSAVRSAGLETAWVSLPRKSGPAIPRAARKSAMAWVIARRWASVKLPSRGVPRWPLVPKLTRWPGSAGSGRRS